MKTDLKALQFLSRFSLPPNTLGYCGNTAATEKFTSCILKGECSSVAKEIKDFIVLNPYLNTIASLTKKPKLSYEVVESYWLGNNLLQDLPVSGYDLLLDNFLAQGVPDFFVSQLKHTIPQKFIPTHLFQVLHVGVGKASGAVHFNEESINNCMIRWGKVQKVHNQKLTVLLNCLRKGSAQNAWKLVQKEYVFPFSPEYLGELHEDNYVAVHWNQVVKILTVNEVKNLSFWTREVLNYL